MITFPLNRPLARLFTYLFYGQIVLYFGISPILLVMMSFGNHESQNTLTSPNGSVLIDSVQIGDRMIAALHDTTGTLSMNMASYPAALTIASVHKVDSVFKANLNVDNVLTTDGYYVRRPTRGSSFWYSLPIGGRVNAFILTRGKRDGNPSYEHRYTEWFHRLRVDGPAIRLSESGNHEDDQLKIEMYSWADWLAIPLLLKLSIFVSWLPAFFALAVTFQFMKLFSSLDRNEVFSELQLRRVNYIGYSALLYVFMRMACDLFKVIAIRRYINGLGYTDESLFQTPLLATLTIEWSWLLMGLCILALAQVFRNGMQLQQENELTI